MIMPPVKREYKGSLEERAQEAIIIFNSSPPSRPVAVVSDGNAPQCRASAMILPSP